jgi:hypothetical protein
MLTGGGDPFAMVVLQHVSVRDAWLCRRVCKDLHRWCTLSLKRSPRPVALGGSNSHNAAVGVCDGSGAHMPGQLLKSGEALDLATMQWSAWALELPVEAQQFAACAMPEGDMLVGGGAQLNMLAKPSGLYGATVNEYSAVVHRWSAATRAWTQAPAPPHTTAHACPNEAEHVEKNSASTNAGQRDDFFASRAVALPHSNRALVLGGIVRSQCAAYDQEHHVSEGHATNRVAAYDPSTDSWSEAAPMEVGRANFCAEVLSDGNLLVAGGYDSKNHLLETNAITCGAGWHRVSMLNSAELYDVAENKWTALPDMPCSRASAASCVLSDGRAALFGGFTNEQADPNPWRPTPTALAFDPLKSRWQRLPNMPVITVGMTATAMRGSVVLTGGVYPHVEHWGNPNNNRRQRPAVSNLCYIFDEDSGVYYRLPETMMESRVHHWSFASTAAAELQHITAKVEQLAAIVAQSAATAAIAKGKGNAFPDAAVPATIWSKMVSAGTGVRVKSRRHDGSPRPAVYDVSVIEMPTSFVSPPKQHLEAIQRFLRGKQQQLELCVGGGIEHASAWCSRLRDPPSGSQLDLGWSAEIKCGQPKRKLDQAWITITKTKKVWDERHAESRKEEEEALAEARGQLREAQAWQ